MDWKSFLYSLAATTTVTTVLIVFAGFLARTWLIERLRGGIKHEYDDRLENLKAGLKEQSDRNLAQLNSEIDRQTDKLRTAISSYTDVQKATIGRKVEAVDILWQGYLKVADAFPSSIYFTDIFTDAEMQEFWTSPAMERFTVGVPKLDETDFFKVGLSEVQAVRPHIGEYARGIYVTYRTILGRSIYLIKEGRSHPSKLAWHNDQNIQKLLRTALGEDALKEFISLGHSRFNWLGQRFSGALLAAIDKILTGQTFSEAALAQAHKMDQQIAEEKRIEARR